MFDCGMHMGYSDERRFPDFSLISKTGNFTQAIDCIIITHFHLDHVGALPYFTEVCGYEGPIYMTYPTKALAPLMLEDYRKVMVDRRGEQEQFSVLQIHQCMKKVTAVDLRQSVNIGDLQLRAYYAGHVLGAAMFYVKVGDSSVLYTGDYSMTPDRHLGAAHVDRLQPDLIITESTYATTIRDSKHAREREFLKAVHTCVAAGGKVLIPVFALGRAQELCILLDEYWERVNLKVPIYFSAGLTMQANVYYKLLISWTNQKVKDTYVTRNTFDFKHVSSFERSQIDVPGPCVLFATPGMLSGGLSLEVFKHWAPSEHNMVVVPGYCVAGTVGHKLMSGKSTRIDLDKRTQLDVRCQIHHLSFSAHTDAKGIMDLLKHVRPRHVILVHGEKPKMALLKSKISTDLEIPCFNPANNETVETPSRLIVKVQATKQFLTNSPDLRGANGSVDSVMSNKLKEERTLGKLPHVSETSHLEGVLMMDQARKIKAMHPTEALVELGIKVHKLSFSCLCPLYLNPNEFKVVLESSEAECLQRNMEMTPTQDLGANASPKVKDVVTEVEPVKKKYRMDLQRILSLDLEREPVMDETEEISNENPSIEETASGKISDFDDFHKQFRETGNGSQNTLDLDINVVPDLPTSKKNCTESTKEPRPLSLGSSQILHAVYKGLVQWLGSSILEESEDCIKGGSFCIRVSCDCVSGKEDFTEKIPAVVLACKWSYEDERLANKAISLLRTMRFKLE